MPGGPSSPFGGRAGGACGSLRRMGRGPQDLDDDERARLRRAHFRLRNASQALEVLTAPQKMRGRWDPTPPTEEALEGARSELRTAYEAVWRIEAELFG